MMAISPQRISMISLLVVLFLTLYSNAAPNLTSLVVDHNRFYCTFPSNTGAVDIEFESYVLHDSNHNNFYPMLFLDCSAATSKESFAVVNAKVMEPNDYSQRGSRFYRIVIPPRARFDPILELKCLMQTYDKALWDLSLTYKTADDDAFVDSYRDIHPSHNLFPMPIQAVLPAYDEGGILDVTISNLFWLTGEFLFGFAIESADSEVSFNIEGITSGDTGVDILRHESCPYTVEGGKILEFHTILIESGLEIVRKILRIQLHYSTTASFINLPYVYVFYNALFPFKSRQKELDLGNLPEPLPENFHKVQCSSLTPSDNLNSIEFIDLTATQLNNEFPTVEFVLQYHFRSTSADAFVPIAFSPTGLANYPFATKIKSCATATTELHCAWEQSEFQCLVPTSEITAGYLNIRCKAYPTILFHTYPLELETPHPPFPLEPTLPPSLGVSPIPTPIQSVSEIWAQTADFQADNISMKQTFLHYGSQTIMLIDGRQFTGLFQLVQLTLPGASDDIEVTIRMSTQKLPNSSSENQRASTFAVDFDTFNLGHAALRVRSQDQIKYCPYFEDTGDSLIFICSHQSISSKIDFILFTPLSAALSTDAFGRIDPDIEAIDPFFSMKFSIEVAKLLQYENFSEPAIAYARSHHFSLVNTVSYDFQPLHLLPYFCIPVGNQTYFDDTTSVYTQPTLEGTGLPSYSISLHLRYPSLPTALNVNSILSSAEGRTVIRDTVLLFTFERSLSDPVFAFKSTSSICRDYTPSQVDRDRVSFKYEGGSITTNNDPGQCFTIEFDVAKVSIGYIKVQLLFQQMIPNGDSYKADWYELSHSQRISMYISTVGDVRFGVTTLVDKSAVQTILQSDTSPQPVIPVLSAWANTFNVQFLHQVVSNFSRELFTETELIIRLYIQSNTPILINSLTFVSPGSIKTFSIPQNFFITKKAAQYYFEIHGLPSSPNIPSLLWRSEHFNVLPKCQVLTSAGPQSLCLNGGTCQANGVCTCVFPWVGEHCQTFDDPCANCNIAGGATCSSATNYKCVCPADNSFTGPMCATPRKCDEGGICRNGGYFPTITDYTNCPTTCICLNSWSPSTCQRCGIECANGGRTKSSCTGCNCPAGLTGSQCNCVGVQVKVTIAAYNPIAVEWNQSTGNTSNTSVPDLANPDLTELEFSYAILHNIILTQLSEVNGIVFQSMRIASVENQSTTATAVPYKTIFTFQISYNCVESNPTISSTAPFQHIPADIINLDVIQTTFLWDRNEPFVPEDPEITPTDSTLEQTEENGSAYFQTFVVISSLIPALLLLLV